MKKLFTKLLLVMVAVIGVGLSANANDYYIKGAANAMDSKSELGISVKTLSTDGNNDIYFWVSGQFAISKSSNFVDGRFVIKYQGDRFYIDWGWKYDTNDGNTDNNWNQWNSTNPKFVKIHFENNNDTVTVQTTPFSGHEGAWGNSSSTTEYDYYLWNSQNDWGNNPQFSGSPLTVTLTDPAGVEFGIKATPKGQNVSGDDPWFIPTTSDINVNAGKTTEFIHCNTTNTNGKFNSSLPEGDYKVELVINSDNTPTSIKITAPSVQSEPVVKPSLYIGGSFNNNWFKPEEIAFADGKYAEYSCTVTAGSEFRFYTSANVSDSDKSTWICPAANPQNIGESGGDFTAKKSNTGYVFKFEVAGTYTIRIDDYNNDTVNFSVVKNVYIPESLFLRSNWFSNWGDNKELVYDEDTKTFSLIVDNYNSDGTFEFNFFEKDADNDHWADRGLLFYPVSSKDISKNNVYNIDNIVEKKADPNTSWKYWDGTSEAVEIIVDFSKYPVTVKVVSYTPEGYYFIGDLNQWFSKEFTSSDSGTKKGINTQLLKNKKRWKFEEAGDGWYKFSNFPNALLAGQFQIFDGKSWNNAGTYSHAKIVKADKNVTNIKNNFETYFGAPVNVSGDGNKVDNLNHGQGQNLHLPCNAVENAIIMFKPATATEPGKIKVIGKMVDYYIFYDRSGDTNHSGLRAHINSAKPNANNYYIPFNKVEYDDGTETVTLNNYDSDHMNNTSGRNDDSDGYEMKRKNFFQIGADLVKNTTQEAWKAAFKKKLYELLPNAEESLITGIVEEQKLPNGISIVDRDIWYAKIPNGFEYPAGTKFAVAFRNSLDDNSWNGRATDSDKTPLWTPVSTNNLYFFDGVHVHMNSELIEKSHNVDVKIEYRVYTYNNKYETVVLDADDNATFHTVATAGNVADATHNDNSDKGWVKLDDKHVSHSTWGHDDYIVCDDNCSSKVWRVRTVETGNTDIRKEIPAGLSNAYLQFRITYTKKSAANSPAKAAGQQGDAWVVTFPDYPTIEHDENEVQLNGADYYRVLDATDNVVTGIEEIFGDEDWSDEVSVEAAEPVYYNLQGVRVASPTKGLYIKVTGNKSEKVLF